MIGFHALLLAADTGRRFGGRKLLVPWRGEPLVYASARIALAAPIDHVVAVVGYDGEDVAAALEGISDPRLHIVEAPDWAEGLSATLGQGLVARPAKSRGVAGPLHPDGRFRLGSGPVPGPERA